MKIFTGIGYDVHRLVPGRPLILGGVKIPFRNGLQGHSDADVLVHAATDALLGAASMGDIGEYFPDSDPAYKNLSSLIILEETGRKLLERGYQILHIDCILVMQEPKILNYKYCMRENMAEALELDIKQINIKATTEEGLGFTGRGEGIAAHSSANIYTKDDSGES